MSRNMNIKIDDNTHDTFTAAAKIISDTGITIPVTQRVEIIINAELAGMNPKKVARKFAKSLMNRLSGISPDPDPESEEDERRAL